MVACTAYNARLAAVLGVIGCVGAAGTGTLSAYCSLALVAQAWEAAAAYACGAGMVVAATLAGLWSEHAFLRRPPRSTELTHEHVAVAVDNEARLLSSSNS